MDKIAIIGAGKTGRGFIGRLLAEDNREIIFIDKNKALVDGLNAEKSFDIYFFGGKRPPVTVNNYIAYTWENADIEGAAAVFVSVGGTNLADAGKSLNGLLKKGREYSVVACENAGEPSKILEGAYSGANAGFADAAVFCTTVEKGSGGLDIVSENYPYLQCDKKPLKPNFPQIKGVRPTDGFENFLTRKIYTYNSASAVIAYLGHIKGYEVYSDAANDPEILEFLDKNYEEVGGALCKAFGYDKSDQDEFAALSKTKFRDPGITDTIERNAREPHRKLGPDERIIGPMKLIEAHGGDSGVLQMTAAAMLLYENENDKEWTRIKKDKPHGEILREIAGLEKGGRLYNGILDKLDFINDLK